MNDHLILKLQLQCAAKSEPSLANMTFEDYAHVAVIHLQIWTYESWDSLFLISMSPTSNL